MRFWVLVIVFVLGCGVGFSLPTLGPKYLGWYFPRLDQVSAGYVEGIVRKKQADPDRLLLTVSAQEGAILVTFQKKVPEISLLVEEGDTITLDLRTYSPFVNDPSILRVRKPAGSSPAELPVPSNQESSSQPASSLDSSLDSPQPASR